MSNTYNSLALREDSNVINFLTVLEAAGRKHTAQDFRGLVEQVDRMERQLDAAAREITAMHRELFELQQFHGQPLHNAARQNIDTATRQINQAKERLGSVKDWIVQSAKDVVAAVREKGIGALDNALSFLGVRKGLEAMRENLDSNIQSCDRSLAQVDTISRQYHEVGTATRNFGRAIAGKDIRDDTKDAGKLAKLVAAPFSTLKSLYTGMAKGTNTALGALEKLEQSAKRPSMLENLQALKETAAKEQGVSLSPEKPPKEPSL